MVDGYVIGRVPLKSWDGLSDQDGPERPLGGPRRQSPLPKQKSDRPLPKFPIGILWILCPDVLWS
jgi:hypothetical protein